MGKRKAKDKSSMRNTPQNKVRRIDADLVRCENAVFSIESAISMDECSEEKQTMLSGRLRGLKSHIDGLKTARSAWKSGGPRARR